MGEELKEKSTRVLGQFDALASAPSCVLPSQFVARLLASNSSIPERIISRLLFGTEEAMPWNHNFPMNTAYEAESDVCCTRHMAHGSFSSLVLFAQEFVEPNIFFRRFSPRWFMFAFVCLLCSPSSSKKKSFRNSTNTRAMKNLKDKQIRK